MKIPVNRMDRGFYMHQREYEEAALRVLRSGWYILGSQVEQFEQAFARYVGTRECVGVGNGLDALTLAFRALGVGPGDEVLVQGNAYIACVMGITINGGTPVFVEPDEFFNLDSSKLAEKVTSRTKAILAVHLYGQASDMTGILAAAERFGLPVVEDCAQSHGARCNGRVTGSMGRIGCFSFYPSKNLGAFGDGGAVTTDDPKIARRIRMLRNYGSEIRYQNEEVGMNSRLDELQAALLTVRLNHLDEITAGREVIANRYLAGIHNDLLRLPAIREGCTSVWHQFVIRTEKRDALMAYLKEREIGTLIHYPIPPHLSRAYACLGLGPGTLPITERLAGEVLSLPMYTGMTEEEQGFVIDALNAFGGPSCD